MADSVRVEVPWLMPVADGALGAPRSRRPMGGGRGFELQCAPRGVGVRNPPLSVGLRTVAAAARRGSGREISGVVCAR